MQKRSEIFGNDSALLTKEETVEQLHTHIPFVGLDDALNVFNGL